MAVRFGKRFQVGNGPIEILVVAQPGQIIKGVCRLDKVRFEKLVANPCAIKTFVFNSLEELMTQAKT